MFYANYDPLQSALGATSQADRIAGMLPAGSSSLLNGIPNTSFVAPMADLGVSALNGQLFNHPLSTIEGVAGKALGSMAGSAIGNALMPGAGTVVGAEAGSQLGKLFSK
jgi:hypothetical protein